MPGQARKFTEAQRRAVVRSVTILGRTQLDTIRLAQAGELETEKGESIPSFTIARGTLQGYLRRAVGDPAEEITTDRLRTQLLSALRAEIEAELPKLTGRRKIDFLTQALHAVKAAERPSSKPKPPKAEADEEPKATSESLERLAAALEARPSPKPTMPQESEQTEEQPVVADEGDEGSRSGGQGRSDASEEAEATRGLIAA